MSLIEIAGRNRIFSSLGIEAKLIENLLPLRLKDDELRFNKRPEYASLLIMPDKLNCKLFVTTTSAFVFNCVFFWYALQCTALIRHRGENMCFRPTIFIVI